eukprot:4658273-Amphidinium_carterae.3
MRCCNLRLQGGICDQRCVAGRERERASLRDREREIAKPQQSHLYTCGSGKTINTGKDASPVQILMGDPFNPAVKKAVVLTDAYLDVPALATSQSVARAEETERRQTPPESKGSCQSSALHACSGDQL